MYRRTERLADTVGFQILGGVLGGDVESAVSEALNAGALFCGRAQPLAIFREALEGSIRKINSDPRGRLFQRFLRDGPYEQSGPIPPGMVGKRLSDEEIAAAITFIYSHMVNCFQCRLAELLASRSCVRLLQQLQRQRRLPPQSRLYVGDIVGVARSSGGGFAKGADLHILSDTAPRDSCRVTVAGVVEVKSYRCSQNRLRKQIDRHMRRLASGLRVGDKTFAPGQVKLLDADRGPAVKIGVVPSSWKLPRTFHFEKTDGGRRLCIDPGSPPDGEDLVEQVEGHEWRITLRWSREALAKVAYEMTFWYMEKVGETVYAASGVPTEWSEMTPAEAGRNSAKMMLYYAMLRCRSARENQRAIALYNAYGFGYGLGMNFKNAEGRREMLWPEDLDEIVMSGRTRHGCRIAK